MAGVFALTALGFVFSPETPAILSDIWDFI